MIRGFIKHYWRYLAMALAFATISFLTNSCEVKAESSETTNSITITYQKTTGGTYYAGNFNTTDVVNGGNSYYLLASGIILPINYDVNNLVGSEKLYGRYAICSRGTFTNGWNSFNSSQVLFINTSIPCNFANTYSDRGVITYATFEMDIQHYYPTGMYVNSEIGTYTSTTSTIQLISFEYSFTPFETYYPQSMIFDKLNEINTSVGNINIQSIIDTIAYQVQQQITSQSNQTNQIIQSQNNTTNAINGLNDSITNSNVDNPSSDLTDMNSHLATNSVISDLFTLPIRFYQTILNSVNSTCTPYTLGALFNTNITLPCINIEDLLGSTIYTTIDIGLCGIFVFSIRKKFVDIFSNITSLKDRGNELE